MEPFDASPNAPTRLANAIGGEGATTQPTPESILEKLRTDPRAVVPDQFKLGTMQASSTANAAYQNMQEVFLFFGQNTLLDWGLIWIPGDSRTHLGTSREVWDMLLLWPAKMQEFSPTLFLGVRWFTAAGLVFTTGMYTFQRIAWALSMRNPEGVEPPMEVP
jgi:hypothetical protein